MSHKIASVALASRMGRSPITGYEVWDEGSSLHLIATRQKSAHWRDMVGYAMRLPKNREDLTALCATLLAVAEKTQ